MARRYSRWLKETCTHEADQCAADVRVYGVFSWLLRDQDVDIFQGLREMTEGYSAFLWPMDPELPPAREGLPTRARTPRIEEYAREVCRPQVEVAAAATVELLAREVPGRRLTARGWQRLLLADGLYVGLEGVSELLRGLVARGVLATNTTRRYWLSPGAKPVDEVGLGRAESWRMTLALGRILRQRLYEVPGSFLKLGRTVWPQEFRDDFMSRLVEGLNEVIGEFETQVAPPPEEQREDWQVMEVGVAMWPEIPRGAPVGPEVRSWVHRVWGSYYYHLTRDLDAAEDVVRRSALDRWRAEARTAGVSWVDYILERSTIGSYETLRRWGQTPSMLDHDATSAEIVPDISAIREQILILLREIYPRELLRSRLLDQVLSRYYVDAPPDRGVVSRAVGELASRGIIEVRAVTSQEAYVRMKIPVTEQQLQARARRNEQFVEMFLDYVMPCGQAAVDGQRPALMARRWVKKKRAAALGRRMVALYERSLEAASEERSCAGRERDEGASTWRLLLVGGPIGRS